MVGDKSIFASNSLSFGPYTSFCAIGIEYVIYKSLVSIFGPVLLMTMPITG